MSTEADSGTREARPGLILSSSDGHTRFLPDRDKELLETKLEVKIGEKKVKTINFSADSMQAYVELVDEADIDKVQSCEISLGSSAFLVERFNLMEVWRPYLVARGLEEWIDDSMIAEHFEAEANGAKVECVEVVERGTEAKISFCNPQVALSFQSNTELLGITVNLEVCYSSPTAAEKEDMALAVRQLPLNKIPERNLKPALVRYFSKHTQFKASECRIINGVGYMSFEDPTAVNTILRSPPSTSFYAGKFLDLSAVPVSQMLKSEEEPPSSAFQRTYSSASEDTMSSSCGSLQLKQSLSGERERLFESTSSFNMSDQSDSETSFRRTPRHSDSGIQFSAGTSHSSSASLGRVPEHVPQGISPVKEDLLLEDMEDSQDFDPTFSPPLGPAHLGSEGTTKVLVQDVPSQLRDCILLKYYLSGMIGVDCDVRQYQKGKSLLATFCRTIDFQVLKQKSQAKPLEGGYQLSLYNMSTANNRKILVTIPDQNEELLNTLTIKFHFQYFTGMGSIEDVQLLPPNKAILTFKDPQSVKKVLASKECSVLEDKTMVIEEYYDFMEEEVDAHPPPPSNNLDEPPVRSAPVSNCHPVQYPLEDTKAEWLQGKQQELNNRLLAVKAKASVTHFGPPLVTITPLSGAERLADWDQQVDRVFQTFVSPFKEYSQDLPEYYRDDILKYAKSARGPDLIVKCDNRVLRIAGESGKVDEVEDAICRLFQVRTEERSFPRRHVRYLERFCLLSDLPVQHYKFNCDDEVVQVDANEEGLKLFWARVDSDVRKMQEKSLVLTPAAFTLLSSARGATKILEILGTHQVEYDLSDSDDPPTLYLLSPQRDARLKTIKEAIRKYMYFEDLLIQDPSKFRYCSDIQWKEMVDKLQEDVFAIVTVDQATHSVIVTGEKVVVSSVMQRIKHFLTEQTSVQEQVVIQSQRWTVISKSFGNEIADIKQGVSKEVTITWPQRPTATQAKVTVSIKGSPAEVDRVKGEIEALEKRVCCKEVKVCNIPAALQVVDSMEDKFRALESHYGASIEATLTRDDDTPSGQASAQPTAVCSATCSNGVRIYVYTGNFTKHSFVDAVVNFLRPNSDFQEENTKQLFAAGGVALKEDLGKKMSQFFKQAPGDVFKSHHGKLQCNQLCHCFAPPWAGGNDDEEYYLMESLAKIFSSLNAFNRILFTSICSAPLKYPAEVFAGSLISAVQMNPAVASELTVAVYVNDLPQAREFEKQFKSSGCRMTGQVASPQIVSSSTRSISSPISSFLTLTQGSLLQQQADVYVNSTNPNMELVSGSLSKELLKACGDELQKKCTEQAPLKEETVAITEAKNLKANAIYHVALPDYKQSQASRKFRETVKVILRTAKDNGVKSIAFPSLGVGNLHYPAQVSAKILFEELISFHAKNPGTDMKFFCVVFDQGIHKEFSKEYAKKMNTALPTKKVAKADKKGSGSTRLSVVKSDISEEAVDVIVNTTTAEMKLNDSAVSKAILGKAGPMLQQACDLLVQGGLKLDHGQIVDTKSYGSLRCKKIIHAHVPPRSDAVKSGQDHHALIMEIVLNCLEMAESENMKSISFPAFGFGQGGYSLDEVAEPMLTAFRDFGRRGPKSVETIKVVIFDPTLHQSFYDFFVKFFNIDVSIPQKVASSIYNMLVPRADTGRSVELQDGSASVPVRQHYQVPAGNQVLVFTIFAATKDKCDQIEAKLRDGIKEKAETSSIEKPLIANLIDSDIEDLKKIGNRFQVEVKVLTRISKVEIQGEKSLVKEAKVEIVQVIADIEKTESELKRFQWQNESSSGEVEKYSDEDSFKLERAKAKGLSCLVMVIEGFEVVIDLDRMEERNKDSGDVRKVMRTPIKPQLDLPKTWEPQPVGADGKDEPMHMFDVVKDSPEYQEALKRFHETIGQTVTIVSLKRIQNPVEYGKHVSLRELIAKKYQTKTPSIRQLFHGSKGDSIQLIAVQGFNRNFAADANAAYYGQGVYFAANASYSAQSKYAALDKDGNQSMFICQVIIGKYTQGTKGMKVATQDSKEAYDTLVENVDKPTIFVAMTDAQAYPEYLVTFKVQKGKK